MHLWMHYRTRLIGLFFFVFHTQTEAVAMEPCIGSLLGISEQKTAASADIYV